MANNYSCSEYYQNHPVRNEYGLQILLKSNGYYYGKIDGQIGTQTKNAIRKYQRTQNLVDDGILGAETCSKLLAVQSINESDSKEISSIVYVSEELTIIETFVPAILQLISAASAS